MRKSYSRRLQPFEHEDRRGPGFSRECQLKPLTIKFLTYLCDLRRQPCSVVPPLLVIVLGIPELSLNFLIPFLLFQEPQPSFVFLRSPLGQSRLRLPLGGSGFFLELDESFELLDAASDGFGL